MQRKFSLAEGCWLAGQTFKEQAHGIVFQDYLETSGPHRREEMRWCRGGSERRRRAL